MAMAQLIRKAIDDFRKLNPKFLKRIDVVIFEEEKMFDTFQAVMRFSALSGAKPPKYPTSVPTLVAPQSENVVVRVTSGDVLKSNCEVLINTTGDDYDLRGTIT